MSMSIGFLRSDQYYNVPVRSRPENKDMDTDKGIEMDKENEVYKLAVDGGRKHKFPSTEEANTSLDESSDRPTKRVRTEEPSSTNEDRTEQYPPVQHARIIRDEDEEEKEVLNEILPRGSEVEKAEKMRETLAIAAGLREEPHNHVEPDVASDRLLWQAAMTDAREQRRRRMMEELRRDQERVREQRRRCVFTSFTRQSHDERRFRAPLPLRRALPVYVGTSVSASPSVAPTPSSSCLVSSSSQPVPKVLPEWVFGSQMLPPPPSIPIFILPPSAQPGASNSNRRPATSPRPDSTSVDLASREMILASLRQLRGQFNRTASPQPSQGDIDERLEDDDESGDEDLPLFTAMLQAGNPPSDPEHHREYPVYEVDLDLPEDQPQAGEDLHEEIARLWALAQQRRARVDEEEDGETAEERLERLVREGEAEDGVDLE